MLKLKRFRDKLFVHKASKQNYQNMKINIKATNTTLTPAIKAFIDDKMSVLEDFLKPEHKLHVELEVNKKHKSGDLFRVEIGVRPNMLYAEARAQDFYAALDLALPKIKEQLLKEKDKRLSKRKDAGKRAGRLKRGIL